VNVVRKALIWRGGQQVAPEGKDDKPQRPGELFPLQNAVALLLALPPPPTVSSPPCDVVHGEISGSKYYGRCLTPPWRRQHNSVTSVAVTDDIDFRRDHVGQNAITFRTIRLVRM
jgi:hypothetical protein